MNRPNLFLYATSELSQDAFLCWLLSWASPEFKDSDQNLNKCAIDFIKAMFDKHNISMPETIESVKVRKQDNYIDVLCIVNNTYAIIIEDKTWTKNHSNQLTRYLEDVKSRGFEDKNIIPIYFKIEDQADYSDITNKGYQPFLRKDMLKVLNTYEGKNSILIDYRDYLDSIDRKTDSYRHKKISEWDEYCWIGFYIELQKRLGAGEWDYVPNPAGGFLGFWWGYQGNDSCEQYLQLEENKLCFKIWVNNVSERRKLRDKWHEIIKSQAKKYGLSLVKPPRFGNGEYMTVCILDRDYRETKDGIIDIDKTVEVLKKAEKLLKSVDGKA